MLRPFHATVRRSLQISRRTITLRPDREFESIGNDKWGRTRFRSDAMYGVVLLQGCRNPEIRRRYSPLGPRCAPIALLQCHHPLPMYCACRGYKCCRSCAESSSWQSLFQPLQKERICQSARRYKSPRPRQQRICMKGKERRRPQSWSVPQH
jgi:hypothetical protein